MIRIFFLDIFFELKRIGLVYRTEDGLDAVLERAQGRHHIGDHEVQSRVRREAEGQATFYLVFLIMSPPPTQAKTRRPQADKDPSPFIIISLFFYEHKIFHSIFLNNRAWMISVTPSFADPLHFDMDPQIHFVKRFVK